MHSIFIVVSPPLPFSILYYRRLPNDENLAKYIVTFDKGFHFTCIVIRSGPREEKKFGNFSDQRRLRYDDSFPIR